MKLVLDEKHIIYKIKNIFLIISELKITFFLKETSIIIQGINKENTCLCEIKLDNDILKDYNKGSVDYFSISGNLMHSILKMHEESEEIHLQLTDILQIEFIKNNKLIKNFEISLLNSNGDFILVDEEEGDVELNIIKVKLSNLVNKLNAFGEILYVELFSEEVFISIKEASISLKIDISNMINETISVENYREIIKLNIKNLKQFLDTYKLSDDIIISFTKNRPIVIKHSLDINSYIKYILVAEGS